MSHDLTIKKEGLVTILDERGLGEVIKPLVTEIHLFDTYVAGTSHLKDTAPLYEIETGDILTMQREDNRYDDKAIVILDGKGRKLGYVPEKDNVIFSRLMDAGKLLIAKVNTIKDMEYFMKISISIYLVDY